MIRLLIGLLWINLFRKNLRYPQRVLPSLKNWLMKWKLPRKKNKNKKPPDIRGGVKSNGYQEKLKPNVSRLEKIRFQKKGASSKKTSYTTRTLYVFDTPGEGWCFIHAFLSCLPNAGYLSSVTFHLREHGDLTRWVQTIIRPYAAELLKNHVSDLHIDCRLYLKNYLDTGAYPPHLDGYATANAMNKMLKTDIRVYTPQTLKTAAASGEEVPEVFIYHDGGNHFEAASFQQNYGISSHYTPNLEFLHGRVDNLEISDLFKTKADMTKKAEGEKKKKEVAQERVKELEKKLKENSNQPEPYMKKPKPENHSTEKVKDEFDKPTQLHDNGIGYYTHGFILGPHFSEVAAENSIRLFKKPEKYAHPGLRMVADYCNFEAIKAFFSNPMIEIAAKYHKTTKWLKGSQLQKNYKYTRPEILIGVDDIYNRVHGKSEDRDFLLQDLRQTLDTSKIRRFIMSDVLYYTSAIEALLEKSRIGDEGYINRGVYPCTDGRYYYHDNEGYVDIRNGTVNNQPHNNGAGYQHPNYNFPSYNFSTKVSSTKFINFYVNKKFETGHDTSYVQYFYKVTNYPCYELSSISEIIDNTRELDYVYRTIYMETEDPKIRSKHDIYEFHKSTTKRVFKDMKLYRWLKNQKGNPKIDNPTVARHQVDYWRANYVNSIGHLDYDSIEELKVVDDTIHSFLHDANITAKHDQAFRDSLAEYDPYNLRNHIPLVLDTRTMLRNTMFYVGAIIGGIFSYVMTSGEVDIKLVIEIISTFFSSMYNLRSIYTSGITAWFLHYFWQPLSTQHFLVIGYLILSIGLPLLFTAKILGVRTLYSVGVQRKYEHLVLCFVQILFLICLLIRQTTVSMLYCGFYGNILTIPSVYHYQARTCDYNNRRQLYTVLSFTIGQAVWGLFGVVYHYIKYQNCGYATDFLRVNGHEQYEERDYARSKSADLKNDSHAYLSKETRIKFHEDLHRNPDTFNRHDTSRTLLGGRKKIELTRDFEAFDEQERIPEEHYNPMVCAKPFYARGNQYIKVKNYGNPPTCTCKTASYEQALPGVKPTHFGSCEKNLFAALFARGFNSLLRPDSKILPDFYHYVTKDWWKRHERDIEQEILQLSKDDLSMETFIKNTASAKRKIYESGMNTFIDKGFIDDRFEAFVKPNELNYTEKKAIRPRLIYNPSVQMKAVGAYIARIFIKVFKKIEPGFKSGYSMSELSEHMNEHFRNQEFNDDNVYSYDGSSHDAHQHPELITSVDHFITSKMLKMLESNSNCIIPIHRMPEVNRVLTKLEYDIFTKNGFKAKVTGTVFSGHPTLTTCYNTLRTILYNRYVAWTISPWLAEHCKIWASGDDVLAWWPIRPSAEIITNTLGSVNGVGCKGLGQCPKDFLIGKLEIHTFLSKKWEVLNHKTALIPVTERLYKAGTSYSLMSKISKPCHRVALYMTNLDLSETLREFFGDRWLDGLLRIPGIKILSKVIEEDWGWRLRLLNERCDPDFEMQAFYGSNHDFIYEVIRNRRDDSTSSINRKLIQQMDQIKKNPELRSKIITNSDQNERITGGGNVTVLAQQASNGGTNSGDIKTLSERKKFYNDATDLIESLMQRKDVSRKELKKIIKQSVYVSDAHSLNGGGTKYGTTKRGSTSEEIDIKLGKYKDELDKNPLAKQLYALIKKQADEIDKLKDKNNIGFSDFIPILGPIARGLGFSFKKNDSLEQFSNNLKLHVANKEEVKKIAHSYIQNSTAIRKEPEMKSVEIDYVRSLLNPWEVANPTIPQQIPIETSTMCLKGSKVVTPGTTEWIVFSPWSIIDTMTRSSAVTLNMTGQGCTARPLSYTLLDNWTSFTGNAEVPYGGVLTSEDEDVPIGKYRIVSAGLKITNTSPAIERKGHLSTGHNYCTGIMSDEEFTQKQSTVTLPSEKSQTLIYIPADSSACDFHGWILGGMTPMNPMANEGPALTQGRRAWGTRLASAGLPTDYDKTQEYVDRAILYGDVKYVNELHFMNSCVALLKGCNGNTFSLSYVINIEYIPKNKFIKISRPIRQEAGSFHNVLQQLSNVRYNRRPIRRPRRPRPLRPGVEKDPVIVPEKNNYAELFEDLSEIVSGSLSGHEGLNFGNIISLIPKVAEIALSFL